MARRYSNNRRERYESLLNPADPYEGIAEVRVYLPSDRIEKIVHFLAGARVKNVKEKLRNTLGVVGGSLILNDVVCLDHEVMKSSRYNFSGFEPVHEKPRSVHLF